MSAGNPRANLVGAAKPRDASAYVAVDQDTGELFAVVTLAEWEALASDAREFGPCGDECNAASCMIARRVLSIDTEVSR